MGSWGREDLMQGSGWRAQQGDRCGAGQAARQLADPSAPHSRTDKLGGTAGERSRLRNPGIQCGEIKPQPSE